MVLASRCANVVFPDPGRPVTTISKGCATCTDGLVSIYTLSVG
jgi:hypothetical protein